MATLIRCDASKNCPEPVAYVDEKGFVYCQEHGIRCQQSGWKRCRKMRPHELNRVARGETIERY